jgi:hypothetical protein
MGSCHRFCHQSSESDEGERGITDNILRSIQQGDYNVSDLQKGELFRLVDVDRLALPPQGFQQIDVVPLLPWPFNELFSEDGIAALQKTHTELAAQPRPRAKLHTADPAEYGTCLVRLQGCGLVRFFEPEEFENEPNNGWFALKKSEDKDRLVINNKPGNFDSWGMEALQRRYTALLAANRTSACAGPPCKSHGNIFACGPGQVTVGRCGEV